MAGQIETRAPIFVSYSHKDARYLQRLHIHLAHYTQTDQFAYWDDTKIKAGAAWRDEIKEALTAARIAVLLVSADFLASKFIAENELPPLLSAARDRGVVILSVILSPCAFNRTPLARFQAINEPSRPLSSMSHHGKEEVWAKVADAIMDALVETDTNEGSSQPPTGSLPQSDEKQAPLLSTPLRHHTFLYLDGDSIGRFLSLSNLRRAPGDPAEVEFEKMVNLLRSEKRLRILDSLDQQIYEGLNVGDIVVVRGKARLPKWEHIAKLADEASDLVPLMELIGQDPGQDDQALVAIKGIKQLNATKAAEGTKLILSVDGGRPFRFVAKLKSNCIRSTKDELETEATIYGRIQLRLQPGRKIEVFRLLPDVTNLDRMNRAQRRHQPKASNPSSNTNSPYDEFVSYPAIELVPFAIHL